MKKIIALVFVVISLSINVFGQITLRNIFSEGIVDVSSGGIINIASLKLEKDATMKLSNIADSVSYVRLSNDVLLADIGLIKPLDDRHLIVFSNSIAYRYTNAGKYVNKLFSSGRAANEAVCLEQPIVNSDRNFILVNDNISPSYKKFSGDGKFLGRQDKFRERIHLHTAGYVDNYEVIWLEKDNWHDNPQQCNPFTDYIFEVRNIDSGEIVYKYPNPHAKFRYAIRNKGSMFTGNDVCLGRVKSGYWFKIKDIDTIYTTTNFKDIKYRYTIKTPEPRLDFVGNMQQRYGATDLNKSKYFRNREIFMTERYIFLDFSFKDFNTYSCCYDTKTGKLSGFQQKIVNDIDAGCDIDNIWGVQFGSEKAFYYGNKLYVPLDAVKILDQGKQKKFPGLTENSNPVIMVVHLKN